MALANYSDLQASIADWLARDDLTSAIVDFIALGEARIYRELRVRAMETTFSDTIASGVIALPSGYKELKNAYVDGSPTQKLSRKTAEWIYSEYPSRSAEAKPVVIAREGSNFIFGPFPDSTYTIKGIYYKKLDPLSDSNPTNWLTDDNPDLILYASLLASQPYNMADDRLPVWSSLYKKAKATAQAEDKREELSGSIIEMVAG